MLRPLNFKITQTIFINPTVSDRTNYIIKQFNSTNDTDLRIKVRSHDQFQSRLHDRTIGIILGVVI